jgi:hypothetical protein
MILRVYISKFAAKVKGELEFPISTMLASDEISAEEESMKLMMKAYKADGVIPRLIGTRVVPDQHIIAAYQSLQQLSGLIK